MSACYRTMAHRISIAGGRLEDPGPFHHVSSTKQGQQGQQKATESPCWLPALPWPLWVRCVTTGTEGLTNHLFGLWKVSFFWEHFAMSMENDGLIWGGLTSFMIFQLRDNILIIFVKLQVITNPPGGLWMVVHLSTAKPGIHLSNESDRLQGSAFVRYTESPWITKENENRCLSSSWLYIYIID